MVMLQAHKNLMNGYEVWITVKYCLVVVIARHPCKIYLFFNQLSSFSHVHLGT